MIRACLCLLVGISGLSVCSSSAIAQSSSIFGSKSVTASSGNMSNGVAGSGNSYGGAGSLTGFTGTSASSAAQGFASGAATGGGIAGRATTGFVGNRNASNSAVQNGQVNMNGSTGNVGARGTTGNAVGRAGQNRNRQNRNNNNNNASGGARSVPIRPAQVIAFQPPARTAEGMTTAISSDLAYAVAQGRISGVGVKSDATGNVTITGNVATQTDRKKAEAMVRLQPGVRHIENQITVGQ